ncbi:mannose-1-phosphate guanylyltransferase [bacterium]|nr:mannose-1-phosphate guanylyltransferase [bacterium]
MKPVLICGGVGTKMWPLSRSHFPKHFLPLFGDKSLFQLNYEVLREKFSPQEIYVETTESQVKLAHEQAPEIPEENFFVEPEMRNHGPAMGFMAANLYRLDPDEPFVLVQTDVLREPEDKFLAMIDLFEKLVKEEKKLVTGGVRPSYAVMGVDYLRAEKLVKEDNGIKVYQMSEWLGRDNKERVEEFLKKKAVLAHANHYSWTPRLFLESYRRRAPDWYQPLKKIIAALGTGKEKEVIKREYAKMEKGPVERVTQKELEGGFVVEVPFEWVDFGTWESLARHPKIKKRYEGDKEVLLLDANNCFVHKPKEKFVALIGVDNLVVVDTEDALLICPQEKSGQVKEIVEYLKERKQDHLL